MTANDAGSAPRTLSLCSGVGGLDMALPGQLTGYAEIEPGPAAIMKAEHPYAPNLGNITGRTFAARAAASGPYERITSGDPCQSMSSAGQQRASADARFLWPYVERIIRELRPDEVFLENVQNIVSVPLLRGASDWRGQKGSVLKMRLDALRELGYDAKWVVLGACAVGAPHHRHRWFLRARYVGVGNAGPAERIEAKCGAPRSGGRVLLPTPTTADGKGGPGATGRDGGLNLRTAVTLLPTPRATDIGTEGRRSSEGWRPQLGQALRENGVTAEHWGKYAAAVALWERIIGRPAPDPTVPGARDGSRPRLNPALSEWMMGYPEGYLTNRLDRNAALKAAGNGVLPLQGATAYEILA